MESRRGRATSTASSRKARRLSPPQPSSGTSSRSSMLWHTAKPRMVRCVRRESRRMPPMRMPPNRLLPNRLPSRRLLQSRRRRRRPPWPMSALRPRWWRTRRTKRARRLKRLWRSKRLRRLLPRKAPSPSRAPTARPRMRRPPLEMVSHELLPMASPTASHMSPTATHTSPTASYTSPTASHASPTAPHTSPTASHASPTAPRPLAHPRHPR